MKTILKSIAAGAAMLGLSMAGSAHADGTSPAFPFAATGFVAGGVSFLEPSNSALPVCLAGGCDREIAHIVAGGDFVIPVTGHWNIQLGGAFWTDHEHAFFSANSFTQFQGGGIGFWRDPTMGTFGVEAGLFTAESTGDTYFKIGGVGEYYWSEMATINVFGGVLIPEKTMPFGPGFEVDTGFYTGGHATWYATDNLALAAFGRYLQLTTSQRRAFETERNNLVVGGKVRFLTPMQGIEVFLSGAYQSCWLDVSFNGATRTGVEHGVEVMAGVNLRLGGRDGSLVEIDRSNALDTRAWGCLVGRSNT